MQVGQNHLSFRKNDIIRERSLDFLSPFKRAGNSERFIRSHQGSLYRDRGSTGNEVGGTCVAAVCAEPGVEDWEEIPLKELTHDICTILKTTNAAKI